MAKIVDGKVDLMSLHSAMGVDAGGIAAHITSGVTFDRHRMGMWGAVGKNYERVALTREGK